MLPRHIKLDDDSLDAGVPMRERYERFCGHFAESGGNPQQAFRLAFVVDKRAAPAYVESLARQLLKSPDIRARVQALRDDAVAQTIVTIRDIVQDFYDIASADPNELVSVVHDACRFCHGLDHRYQWVDEAEYAQACEDALTTPAVKQGHPPRMPDMAGGFGYHPRNDANMTCPRCFGDGVSRQIIHDTSKVSPKARKLYAGMKKGDVVMHDQMKARELLGKMMGAFTDGIPLTPVTPNAQPIAPDMQEQDAGRAYLQLIQGGKS